MTFQSDKGIEEINNSRQGHGAPPLKCDWILEDKAQAWADKLAQNGVLPECKIFFSRKFQNSKRQLTKIVIVSIECYFLQSSVKLCKALILC